MATRTQAARRPAAGRFTRSAGTPAKRPVRVSRRKPQKTGMAKLLDGVTAAAAKKGGGGGGKGRRPAWHCWPARAAWRSRTAASSAA